MEGTKLKMCPFCGLPPKVYKASKARGLKEEGYFTDCPVYTVQCQRRLCDVQPSTREYESRERAISAWNRRITDGIEDCSAPTADVAEVVRCKDCFWWNEGKIDPITNFHYGCCERPLGEYHECDYTFDTTSNDFCSYGERKE